MTIGDVRAWSLDDARTEVRRLQTEIDQGNDPREQKRERIAAAEARREEVRRIEAHGLDAWNAYIEARRPKWGECSYQDHLNLSKEGARSSPEAARRPRTAGRNPEPCAPCWRCRCPKSTRRPCAPS